MSALNETHDPSLRSWVSSANTEGCDFPIQNLPFGRFRTTADGPWRVGVAIGNQVLDLQAAGLLQHADMTRLLSLPADERSALRLALSRGLRQGSARRLRWEACLLPQSGVQLGLPCDVGDYTDFYVGVHHATAVGKLFRPDNPLLPNYKWVPIGYHGRSSTIIPSGQPFVRPRAQVKSPDAEVPSMQPTARLDFELELGIVIGQGNPMGRPVSIDRAEEHVYGLTLFNDWSARDVQAWEYQPLGPFLSKNFASTISPWIVTLEALAPFRQPFTRPKGDPQPLAYLMSAANTQEGAFGIQLEVWLQTAAMRVASLPGDCISRSQFAVAAYWTVAQMVAHHTVGGCALRPGDLLGTGTLSGPQPDQAGSLLELSQGGKRPLRLSNGEERTFLQDGDEITFKGYCERPGAVRIGFGLCSGMVMPCLCA
ncbi:MAG: fumarylacetoacetase [Curvibacter sp.]|jgi:fumarylacetoacetase